MGVKSQIIQYLKEKRRPMYKGVIEDFTRQSPAHSLGDTASRRLRELTDVSWLFGHGQQQVIFKVEDLDGNTMYEFRGERKIEMPPAYKIKPEKEKELELTGKLL